MLQHRAFRRAAPAAIVIPSGEGLIAQTREYGRARRFWRGGTEKVLEHRRLFRWEQLENE